MERLDITVRAAGDSENLVLIDEEEINNMNTEITYLLLKAYLSSPNLFINDWYQNMEGRKGTA